MDKPLTLIETVAAKLRGSDGKLIGMGHPDFTAGGCYRRASCS